jgi:putative copper export protein/methionine-rich copper-binding protein CopC/mono/diheme cytochrome c family protein
MRSSRIWPLVVLVAAALAVVVGLSWPRVTSAHAILQRSLPVQNQKLQQPPALVETWYSESIERSLTKLTVFDATGKAVQTGNTTFSDSDPTYAAVALPPNLSPSIYTVAFQNVSKVDGHTWTGSFSFIVLNPDGTVPNVTPCTNCGNQVGGQGYLPEAGDSTLRWFELLAAVTITGALVFYVFIARPSALFLKASEIEQVEKTALMLATDLIVIAAPVLILSAIGQLLLLADRLGGPSRLGDILFNTRSGELWLSRIGLSLALLLLFAPALFSTTYRTGGRAALVVVVGLAGSLGLLMTYSLGSHAGTGGGQFWAVGSDFVHFLATAAWLGAMLQLPLLFWWTRGRLDSTKRFLYLANAFDRYAWLAVISLTLLIGTGVFNGFVQLPNRPALWDTTYGRVLIVKLALILPLLGVAGLNAIFLAPRLSDAIDALHNEEDLTFQADEAARRRLEGRLARLQRVLPRTIALEVLLGVAVLASVAVLAQSTTANGELQQKAGKPSGQYKASNQAGDLNADLLIKPFGLAVSTFTVTLQPQAGSQLGDILDVKLRAFYDDPNAPLTAGSSGTDQELSSTSQPGVWSADSALLTRPGDWRIQIRVRRGGAASDVTTQVSVLGVGGILALKSQPKGLFDLPFTFVDWNVVAGGAMLALGIGAFLIWRNRPPSWEGATSASVALASIVALFAGTTLVFGVHAHQGVVGNNSPVPATQQSLATGQTLFETNCVTCHGREGRGDGPLANQLPTKPPDLTQHVPYHNDGTLFIWISQGIPIDSSTKRMPAFKGSLTVTERWDIVNYLRHAWGSGQFTPVLPTDQPTPPPS